MALNRITGSGIGLGAVQYQLPGGNNEIVLQGGQTYLLPAGQYMITPDPYTFIQILDPITGLWRNLPTNASKTGFFSCDGYNMRLANLTGCALGAIVTNVGSGYTSAPVVTASAGSSTWLPIWTGIGLTSAAAHIVNSTVTVTNGGTYTYTPQIVFSAPPAGGVPATGYVTLSGSAINSVTVVDQGAGYTSVPTITIIPDVRETAAGGGVLTATLTGSGTIGALLCTNPGTAVTAVPTLNVSGGGGSSFAATVEMCFTATGLTVTNGGAAYGNAQPFLVTTAGGANTGTAGASVNPAVSSGLLTPRPAQFLGTSTAGGAITATGLVIVDAGLFMSVPNAIVIAGNGNLPTTVGAATVTVGATTSRSVVVPV
jgi:hypothetical protein